MHADLVEELLSREAAQGIKPDPDTDAYLRATIFGSKKNNLVVEMVIRLLGLHTCADTVVVSHPLQPSGGHGDSPAGPVLESSPLEAALCMIGLHVCAIPQSWPLASCLVSDLLKRVWTMQPTCRATRCCVA